MAEAMAASSGGINWPHIIKVLMSVNYKSVTQEDLIEICSVVNKSESDLLHPKQSQRIFYNAFAMLAADCISYKANSLSVNHMDIASNACKILIKYLVNALKVITAEPVPNLIHANRILTVVKALCIGTGPLSRNDHAGYAGVADTLPIYPKKSLVTEDETPVKSDSSKTKSDLSVNIFEQLTLPLRNVQNVSSDIGGDISSFKMQLTNAVNTEQAFNGTDFSSDIKKVLLANNSEVLQGLKASDILLDLCLKIPSIKKSKIICNDALAGKPFVLPTTVSEANSARYNLSTIMSDICLIYGVVSLPILEPLNSAKLEKLCTLCMACLHCAISQAAMYSVFGMNSTVLPKCSIQIFGLPITKEEDNDYSNAVTIVEKALIIYSYIGSVIKNSSRAGGHIYQNFLLTGAWVLLSGLQVQLSIANVPPLEKEKMSHTKDRDEKGRSPSKSRDPNLTRISLMKIQQGFNALSVALASRLLSIMSNLLDDLHLEMCSTIISTRLEPAPLSIMGQFSALQRTVRLLGICPLNQILFYLATITYRKACTLKRIQKHHTEGDTFSQSDSTTYYEDMIICSDESSTDEDDDSEPILGQWFEETLAPPDNSESTNNVSSSENPDMKPSPTEQGHSLVPDKGEPHGYIKLATQVFVFMNKYFLSSKSGYVSRYVKNGLTEQQMMILAAIIKDLDRESARTEIGTISVYFGPTLGHLYAEFSSALARYTHNLVTHNGLTNLHTWLLSHLGISPWNVDVPHAWPLQVYSRSLAVLTQIILLRPQQEKEASIISIWRRLVNTLVENVINPPIYTDADMEDLNVEHMQVLLYLFHSLTLMQKKSILLLTGGGVVRGSEVARARLKDSQLLHLSRLLLLLDYLMKHLYDIPNILLEQIQWNLFYSTNLGMDNVEKEKNLTRMYTSYLEIEANYRKYCGPDEFTMKPRFYTVTNLELNNQDVPKLDGLACNFILGAPDKLRYHLLLDALIEILNITNVTSGLSTIKLSYLGLCATQYCFTICWRLLLCLPPSTLFMDKLISGDSIPVGLSLLHSLIWGPRSAHKTFTRWVKDSLQRQGMYTQYIEKIIKAAGDTVNALSYDVNIVKTCIITLTPKMKKDTYLVKEVMPPLWHLFLLDSVMAKVTMSLIDEVELSALDSTGMLVSGDTHVQDLLPHVIKLAESILYYSRWSLVHAVLDHTELIGKFTLYDGDVGLLQDILCIFSAHNRLTTCLVPDLTALLPSVVCSIIESWNTVFLDECSLTPFLNDIIPAESYILSIINAHVSTLSMNSVFTINLSLKRLLHSLVKFICLHASKTDKPEIKNKAIDFLITLTLDSRTEYLHENVQKTLDKMIGDSESDEHQKRIYLVVLEHSYYLITNYTTNISLNHGSSIDEKILHHCIKFWEKMIDTSAGRSALEIFFGDVNQLVTILLSISISQMSLQYSTKVLHFFNKLFTAAEKNPSDIYLDYLCSSVVTQLANIENEKLQQWLNHVLLGNMIEVSFVNVRAPNTSTTSNKLSTVDENPTSDESKDSSDDKTNVIHWTTTQENSFLLQALTAFIVRQNSTMYENIAITILKVIINMGGSILLSPIDGLGFVELMSIMTSLADVGNGKGHQHIFTVIVDWIVTCKNHITQKDLLTKLASGSITTKHSSMIDAICCILNYIEDIINALGPDLNGARYVRALSPPWEGEVPPDVDSEWQDEVEEDDSAAEDSDEDSLCNKLCTFTITQKEFMNQHWYHCHTCRMLDGVGVCSVCARVCHRGHDLSYSKYGNFFCDCGAKEDGSCQALVKRSPQISSDPQPSTSQAIATSCFGLEPMLTSSLRRRPSSPIQLEKFNIYKDKKRSTPLVKHIDGSKEVLLHYLANRSIIGHLLSIVNSLLPSVEVSCARNSPVGCNTRAQLALLTLQTGDKEFYYTDQLVVPTLGSQEGAFENVRMNYSGEQGQTIRQLLSAHIIRRVAMCCMSSPYGKRQHLAISHEKGKITVLQLSALLKQADSAKRKLTLTRLASAPVPFTVLSLCSNSCNEDFLAVCGLKDCHVLTFSSTGSVLDHLVLHPLLETGNFIIKALWLPGAQTELALITADFVKIYDLSKDALSPQYFFLVPSGKIRDCTFVYKKGLYEIVVMSSSGHIYTETMNEDSCAKHGSFYITNTLDVFYSEVVDSNGQVLGGGVSIYYSHTLGLLFFSYAHGKNFIAPYDSKSNSLSTLFPINIHSHGSSKSNGSKSNFQPLCQWTEIANHPGLVCSIMQSSNNIAVLMLRPDKIGIQEIKLIPAKSKIMDMVAIRHISGNDYRTTFIVLCEDGSLKIHMANMEQTGFWMSASIQPMNFTTIRQTRKKKSIKPAKPANAVAFPVDFFEHCQLMNDVEIGGNDLLQLYNTTQLKHRLNSTGMYVVCAKPLGFTIEITNSDNNMVMTGMRILLGTQDIQRTPSYIEIFGRTITVSLVRNRWYDIPFSRDESLLTDKKLIITFGPSQDPDAYTIVDSIKIYGKTKDAFGWLDENEDILSTTSITQQSSSVNLEQDPVSNTCTPLSYFDKLLADLLEVLDSSYCLFPPNSDDKLSTYRQATIEMASKLLCLPIPASLQMHTKALLLSLHSSKHQYHTYKDQTMISHVLCVLRQMHSHMEYDPEAYYRIILITRGIAVSRPHNLVKITESFAPLKEFNLNDVQIDRKTDSSPQKHDIKSHLIYQLLDVLWYLHAMNPDKPALAPVVAPGLKHTEHIIHALVEIIHAFNICDPENSNIIALYLQLLLCEDPTIAFSARQAVCKVLKPRFKRRRVFIPSPPCATPHVKNTGESGEEKPITSSHSSQEDDIRELDPRYDIDSVEALVFLQDRNVPLPQINVNPLEALLGGGGPFPPLLDIPPDADDETMVELAIALSLQEHDLGGPGGQQLAAAGVIAGQALQSLEQVLANQGLVQPAINAAGPSGQNQEISGGGHFSDTTASAAGSDDEGSTAATDGSTLRTSPAEQQGGTGSAGSESGGSGVDSITGEHNVSGRSSSYGDNIQETISLVTSRTETNTIQQPTETDATTAESEEVETEVEIVHKLHTLRLRLLDMLIQYLPKLKNICGVRVIPLMQVILVLTSDLDTNTDKDRATLSLLLGTLINELNMVYPLTDSICVRTKEREVQLIFMRLLSVFMSRWKPTSKSTTTDNSSFITRATANLLHSVNIIEHCSKILRYLLEYWRNLANEENNTPVGGALLKGHLTYAPPDMQPFFLKQYVKGHSSDVFEAYPQLLTEIALRLPYQVHKHSNDSRSVSIVFNDPWYKLLCDYMMTTQTPFVRRQVRKLLLFICGNKEKYKQLRDAFALESHMQAAMKICKKAGYSSSINIQNGITLPYDSLVELMEHLKACLEISSTRTTNWQKFCMKHHETLQFLIHVSYALDEGIASAIIQLLQSAIYGCPVIFKKGEFKVRRDRERLEEDFDSKYDDICCGIIAEQISHFVSTERLTTFVKAFLLDTNVTNLRWLAHAFILGYYRFSKPFNQLKLLNILWQLWSYIPMYGSKAAQFVDLLGYFSLRYLEMHELTYLLEDYVQQAVSVLRTQNRVLAHHPNANLYATMAQFVELDGYYLESEPCLVCNNPDVPLSTIKLSTIKVDSKFTTTTQIVKLISCHNISKITLRIGDLKRTKMVRTINIYYNNRNVQAVVELKNKPALWHKAKKVSLQSGQTEVKIEFPLPIVACNLMIEYAEFYENIQASTETLQCPRCSAAVPANPGVCANCGENVFQCHKCRAINYDEKDPFLCHACGFCKYAKFDYSLLARPCCAVEPIESDEDRKKMVSSINMLLEKADRVYKQLMGNKPSLESLLLKISEQRTDRRIDEASVGGTTSGMQVNKTIQLLAQQYCTECKTSFEELSKIIQRVLVSRKELITYDRKQNDSDPVQSSYKGPSCHTSLYTDRSVKTTRCYGCASATTEHCLTLLRALSTNYSTRQLLCGENLIQELVMNNLRKGNSQIQEEVRQLLCILARNNETTTAQLCHILTQRIEPNLRGPQILDVATGIRYEVALLSALVKKEDECWELKLRFMMHLFLLACDYCRNPIIMDSVILPCLKIIKTIVRPLEIVAIKNQEKLVELTAIVQPGGLTVDVYKWLKKDVNHMFKTWRQSQKIVCENTFVVIPTEPAETRKHYISEKYFNKWRKNVKIRHCKTLYTFEFSKFAWIKIVLFNPSSRFARHVTCNIIEYMCINFERRKKFLLLLTSYLDELSTAGESAAEFLSLYQKLALEPPWKQFLVIHGVLIKLASLITKEIKELRRLEQTTLTTDLAQGYALTQLTELLAHFLDSDLIRQQYKGRLVADVLNGYLSLRRLVVQRTRLIDETQDKLLDLLEEMTTGTEEETKAFMAVCIETVDKISIKDVLTPVFIFERLCSIIYPEENDIGEFFLTLEKDPQQEDFLQGRMLGNPYSCLETGLGPLMRDVKNKICQDCELVALLEDDNGMELLVNNKIMSLDLPVKEVYKKVWLADGGEGDSMRVLYRMRGLLGDATEEFVETLNAASQEAVDNEVVFKMANVLGQCSGLKTMLDRLAAITNVTRARSLLQVLLKLFRLSVKVRRNQEILCNPNLGAIEIFLSVLNLCLESDSDVSQASTTEQLLDIMETVLSHGAQQSLEIFIKFSQSFGGTKYIESLLSCITSANVRNNQPVLIHLCHVLAALVYGNEERMQILLNYFIPVLNFNKFDFEHTSDDEHKLEIFCILTTGIENNAIGNTLKDYIISLDIVNDALEYIIMHAPNVKPTLIKTDNDELKEFISKPALKYVLRFLTGLSQNHEKTQLAVAADVIPIIHYLEQISSDEHVGSLAENLLEALCTNETVASSIEKVREFTRAEKKRLAMIMREKQLGALGMRTNDKGQVTAKSAIMQQIEELGDETGLVCCICREGYKYQPTKVLGIYTFSKRCNADDYDAKPRKTLTYSTVTHFNVVHVECHMSAVRLARGRDEWESAALQNANTKCNGLLPLWGPQVPESAFASCLARHNTYLQEATGFRDISYQTTIMDIKLLLWRFAKEKSFHDDTGGGGPQSNLHMIPYLIHMALYVMNTTRAALHEEKTLGYYLDVTASSQWIESAHDPEGPLYWLTMSLLVHSGHQWQIDRLLHLRRLIVIGHTRQCSPIGPCNILEDRQVRSYATYKPYLIFYGLIDGLYKYIFKNVSGPDEQWSTNLADYIRHNDEALLKASERLLNVYTEELLPCTSFDEFCDVTGLLNVISSPDTYISNLLKSL